MNRSTLLCSLSVMAALMLLPEPAVCQKPLRIRLTDYFDKLIAPPATPAVAYRHAKCPDSLSTDCQTDAMFDSMRNVFIGYAAKLTAQANSAMPGDAGEMMKKMQDPEFQAKLASMSQEEKMKFAMTMSSASTPKPATTPDPPKVVAFMKEVGDITNSLAQDDLKRNEKSTAELALLQEVASEHDGIEAWLRTETDKVPMVGNKVFEQHDPVKVHALKLEAAAKHLVIADLELKKRTRAWKADLFREKTRYARFDAGLISIHYGDDAANGTTKSMLVQAQGKLVAVLQELLGESNRIWNDAVVWARKRDLVEHEK